MILGSKVRVKGETGEVKKGESGEGGGEVGEDAADRVGGGEGHSQ